jgi:ABC-type antimicrobial peptide transport system permease subunit
MYGARRKEIGIRKVVGASKNSIVRLFLREVMILLGIAFLVSSSVAYWLMSQWLENFEERITLGWELISLALLLTVPVSALTMGYRNLMAANLNPVSVLKDE